MARNEEKAMALLNRWTSMKREIRDPGVSFETRPTNVQTVMTLPDCDMWRQRVMAKIARHISSIQNAGIGEHRIRDLNDTINKLLREKSAWEKRIRELGGPNYSKQKGDAYDADGLELEGSGGYMYFGAAKQLPGVRELFEQEAAPPPKRSRFELYQNITPDYYGWRDEDDGVLVKLESEVEAKLVAEKVAGCREAQRMRRKRKFEEVGEEEDVEEEEAGKVADIVAEKVHLLVPSQEDMAKVLLERKKKFLADKYS